MRTECLCYWTACVQSHELESQWWQISAQILPMHLIIDLEYLSYSTHDDNHVKECSDFVIWGIAAKQSD